MSKQLEDGVAVVTGGDMDLYAAMRTDHVEGLLNYRLLGPNVAYTSKVAAMPLCGTIIS